MPRFLKKVLIFLILALTLGYVCYKTSLPLIGGGSKFEPRTISYQGSPMAKKLIHFAYEDLQKPADYHVHVLGIDGSKNTFINPKFQSFFHPWRRYKMEIFMHASHVTNYNNSFQEYHNRFMDLIDNTPDMKYYLFAFDYAYSEGGKRDLNATNFYISNELIYKLAQQNPERFAAVVSIHPFKKNAIDELKKWHEHGVKFVKWVPNSMNIDPSNPSLKKFYETLIQYNMALIVHAGQEAALDTSNNELGNPLKLRFPLDLGVKIIVGHAASLGECQDFESESAEYIPCFNLFMRLMDEKKYQKNLYGDISATYFINRNLDHVKVLLSRVNLHPRLLNGSDYPLIAVNVLINLNKLVKAGLITQNEKKVLKEIYLYNPFLFDFVLKRTLKHPTTKQKFLPIVFEDRKL